VRLCAAFQRSGLCGVGLGGGGGGGRGLVMGLVGMAIFGNDLVDSVVLLASPKHISLHSRIPAIQHVKSREWSIQNHVFRLEQLPRPGTSKPIGSL
jgi:hypothetical protein